MACYLHSVPGRMRVKSRAFRRSPELAQGLADCARSIDGVTGARVNALTGSVLLTYDARQVSEGDLLSLLHRCEHFDLACAHTVDERLRRACRLAGERLGRAVFSLCLEGLLRPTGLSFLAALL